MKKILWFILGGGIAVFLYLIGIGIYTRFSVDPIIFFASVIIDIIVVITVCLFVGNFLKNYSINL